MQIQMLRSHEVYLTKQFRSISTRYIVSRFDKFYKFLNRIVMTIQKCCI